MKFDYIIIGAGSAGCVLANRLTENGQNNVAILNPLSNDLAVMRQSLVFGGLESVSYNINRKNASLHLFEFGKTYHKFNDSYEEQKHLALFVSGNRNAATWTKENKTTDFLY